MSGRLACLLLVLLVACAAFLRLRGIDYLLPLHIEPDAHIAVQVKLIEEGRERPQDDPNWGSYPHVTAWTTMVLTERAPLPEVDAPIEEHLVAAQQNVLRVRIAVAVLSLLSVPATFLVGRLYLTRGWALVAAALAATSLLAVHFGAQARPHGAAVGLTTLALWALVLVRRRGDVLAYALATVLGALAFGTLQSAVALAFPWLVAHFGNARGRGARTHALLVVPVAGVALAMLAFYPFLVQSILESASSDGGSTATEFGLEKRTVVQGGHKVQLSMFNGGGFAILLHALWSWEPVLLVGGTLALLVWAFDRDRKGPRAGRSEYLVVLAYVLPYALVIGVYERSYERFLLPLVPFLAVFVAWGLARVARRGWGGVVLAAVVVALPTTIAWRLVQLRVAPSTLEQAGAWVAEHAAPTDRVWQTRSQTLPLYKSPESEAEDEADYSFAKQRLLNWVAYQRDVLGEQRGTPRYDLPWMPVGAGLELATGEMRTHPVEYLKRLAGGRYVVAEVFEDKRKLPGLTRLQEVLRRRCELVARFSPDPGDGGSSNPLVYQDETHVSLPHMAWRVWNARALGPVLEVFSLPRE
jgi:hypothetical protein